MAGGLRPEVEERIAHIGSMTMQEVQRALVRCIADVQAGVITPYEGNAVTRAANTRIHALQRERFT